MIIGILSLLGATLTLPGIAGIVLTVGIAVDSNVLIYERIREEVRAGRSPISAIDAGFARALGDHPRLQHHHLHCRRSAVLLGSGPVRGFAVTLGIGIITTVFTAFTLTRLMVALCGCAGRARAPPHFIDGYVRLVPIPLLRIVPDDTKFDFMRFRRISFPISAILSIAAIAAVLLSRARISASTSSAAR